MYGNNYLLTDEQGNQIADEEKLLKKKFFWGCKWLMQKAYRDFATPSGKDNDHHWLLMRTLYKGYLSPFGLL